MPTALAIAVAQRFGQEDLRLLTVFVRRFLERDQHREFSAADVEAALRGVLGEQLLLTSVDPGLAIEIMYELLFALVDELELSDDQADGLLAAAEQQMAAADREIGPPPEGPPDPPVLADRMHRRTRQRYLSADDVATPATKNPAESAPGGLGRLFGGSRSKQSRRRGSAAATGKPASLAGRFLSATMLRHSDERQRLSAIVHELGNDDVTRLSRVAFTVAVRRHFSPDVHLRDIADLAAAARNSFYPELNLMITEFMVRAALGEQVPEHGLSVWDEIAAKTLVLALLADWWQRDESAVNATLIQAEAELSEAGGSGIKPASG